MGFRLIVGLLTLSTIAGLRAAESIPLSEIRVRDPFIYADAASKTYFLYRQCGNAPGADTSAAPPGVEVFTSRDLATWFGPTRVFTVPEAFWAGKMVWAPEVHAYHGKFYLFVTFTAAGLLSDPPAPVRQQPYRRGTQILFANSPRGPFQPFANRAHTPADWMSLDGTLWVEDDQPYLIFCHEWVQIHDGTMELMPLAADLSAPAGAPRTLFRATAGPWVKNLKDSGGKFDGFITDGPFLHRTQTGKLIMLWSSFGAERYAIGQAMSESGLVAGPWKQIPDLLVRADGGHGMLFRTFAGRLMLVYHQPNHGGLERAQILPVDDSADTLRLAL